MRITKSFLMTFLVQFLLLLLPRLVRSNQGADISSSCPNFSCFQQSQTNYMLISGYLPNGTVDPNVVTNLQKANTAQITTVDVYMIPCRGQNESYQVSTLVQTIDKITLPNPHGLLQSSDVIRVEDEFPFLSRENYRKNNERLLFSGAASYSDIWIVIQENSQNDMCSWVGYSVSSNCLFIQNIVTELQKRGKNVGISSSPTSWANVFGSASACSNFSTLPLWYVNLDGKAAFDDFAANKFGGWSQPNIKKYAAGTTQCNCTVGSNFYP